MRPRIIFTNNYLPKLIEIFSKKLFSAMKYLFLACFPNPNIFSRSSITYLNSSGLYIKDT